MLPVCECCTAVFSCVCFAHVINTHSMTEDLISPELQNINRGICRLFIVKEDIDSLNLVLSFFLIPYVSKSIAE